MVGVGCEPRVRITQARSAHRLKRQPLGEADVSTPQFGLLQYNRYNLYTLTKSDFQPARDSAANRLTQRFLAPHYLLSLPALREEFSHICGFPCFDQSGKTLAESLLDMAGSWRGVGPSKANTYKLPRCDPGTSYCRANPRSTSTEFLKQNGLYRPPSDSPS